MPFSIELDEEYWCPLSVNASIYSRMEYSVLRGKVYLYERYEFQGFDVGILGLQLEEYVNDPTTILLPNHPYCWALNFFRHLTKVIEVTYSACLCRIISSCPVAAALDGLGVNNFDTAFMKSTMIRKKLNLQFRAEFYNLFNHTRFTSVGTTLGSSTFFGKLIAATDEREIQFALKKVF